MRIISNIAMPAILISAFAAPAIAESADKEGADEQALFVQHADSATLSEGTLTLNGIDKHVIAFSDRPMRATMAIPTAALIEIWNKGKDSFADDPPNAVLTGEVDGKAASVIVELTNPELSEGSLTFDYVVLKGPDSVTLDSSYMVLDETFWGDIDWAVDKVDNDELGAVTLQHIPG